MTKNALEQIVYDDQAGKRSTNASIIEENLDSKMHRKQSSVIETNKNDSIIAEEKLIQP